MTLSPAAASARGEDGPGPLPWRVGGRVGFTVDAAAFPDSAGHRLEVYVRIPPATVVNLVRDVEGDARVRLLIRLKNSFGARQHEASQEFTVPAEDSAIGFGKVVMLPFPVRPGGYRLAVRLEDLQSRRRGIAYVGRKVAQSSGVEGELEVPGERLGRELSDIEFVWHETTEPDAGAFRRGQHAFLPNPERLYGLFENHVRIAFVARATGGEPRPWRWKARVIDAHGTVVAAADSSATPSSRLAETASLDLATEPAGGYDLELKVWQEGDSLALTRVRHFSIAWEKNSWERSPADLEDVVHFLLSTDDEEEFARKHPGEQERYLSDFWRERDPTPDTAENEVRTAFMQRVDAANRNFGRFGLDKGMFSDMGRTLIRYGEPDEVLRQVIPAGDENLSRAIVELELSEDRPTGDVHQKGPGGDTRAFEVWIYEGDARGDASANLNSALLPRPRRRVVFLFVDEQGYGDYTLRYSTE
jgi:GWxTD domain-containing protein